MKTSTKLILIYSGLIVAGVFLVYLSPYLFEDKMFGEPTQLEEYMEQIPDFSVVVIQDTTSCQITLGDSTRIKWLQPSGSVKNLPLATVRNDTLYLSDGPGRETMYLMAKQLTAVVVKESAIYLFETIQDKLYVQLEHSFCTVQSTDNTEKAALLSKTLHLTVNASKKSELSMYGSIDALTVTLDSSKLETYNNAYIRNVTLTEKSGSSSKFQLSPKQLTLQGDSSSTFQASK